ncbi:M48 family metallopeptidase [Youxingia wuxianensis]|uniref:M48 family metallopeptidase n=1 Tax=Youxingia wuxianensis TaxID=2763678 RepID=A0A926ETX7_9FIRM|nr:SprT family zinc-dependent metalloprotease [Youxingia wuxianensis]MBC8586414.1 M48 family metallopeptidase [Youxingia wuxianensis]
MMWEKDILGRKAFMNGEIDLRRSRRKTLSLRVTQDGIVQIRAPGGMPQEVIAAFIKKHETWLRLHQQQALAKKRRREAFEFEEGQKLLYLGKEIPIVLSQEKIGVFEGEFCLPLEKENRSLAAKQWISQQGLLLAQQKAAYFSSQMGVTPAGIKITQAEKRWGSCSGKNRLCFSYRLFCLPLETVEAVIVHELAHIREHNHSPRFYKTIQAVLPDYKQRCIPLKEFEHIGKA